ncbi:poly-beta-1,6 N-acetyl-D-glucosamine export porin PgaA [Pseudomonas sp. M30-35]|uniref:poly-beta-1,6 N-acetyl-D-glucosamine export porin PgaA n=1 Tax=Pseudomonas sp. M30-35 TaxID=1981174 RepID=UPI0021140DD1|nr:poly-beta-1,6 N-acetyl-D-glucosamine export porin PgaA [Pseudomonas sp. M30-35]
MILNPDLSVLFLCRNIKPLAHITCPLCFAVLLGASPFAVYAADPIYDQLIISARNGNVTPALEFLREVNNTQKSELYASDHILIAGWAGLDEEVVNRYESSRSYLTPSADVLTTTARAYRNLQRWPQALAAYNQALRLRPTDNGALVGRVMTLADSGKPADAVQQAKTLVAAKPNDAGRRLALAYAYLRNQQKFSSLNEVNEARRLAPERNSVKREYLLALQRAGVNSKALELAEKNPQLVNARELRTLQRARVADYVRMSNLPVGKERDRFKIADKAIAEADRLLSQWADIPQAQDDAQALRIDRMGALFNRVYMQKVLDEYDAFNSKGVSLPAYALRWVAGASLYLRQPELAAKLYKQILPNKEDKNPARQSDLQGYYYALKESGQDVAAASLVPTIANQPRRLYQKGLPNGKANPHWLAGKVMEVSASQSANDLAAAQLQIETLANSAPGNTELRTVRADIYSARGWPRRSEAELKEAENLSPRSVDVELRQGYTAQQLQEWRQFELYADDIFARYPERLSVRQLERARQLHNMAELRVSSNGGISPDNTVTGSGDYGIDTVLYSSPIDYNWRVFGGLGYSQGTFEEGKGRNRYQRGGLEWRSRDLTLEAEVNNQDYGHGNKQGARLSGSHDLNDYWQYGWSMDWRSRETPLRALNSDITSDIYSGYLSWSPNESRSWRISLTPQRFDDGNDRLSGSISGRERVYTSSKLVADALLDIGASHNSQPADGPYFSPEDDLSIMPGLRLSHLLYERYEQTWSQQAQFGLGSYNQRNYGTDAIGFISYGQRVSINDQLNFGATASALNRPYDGERETEYRLVFDLSYRF